MKSFKLGMLAFAAWGAVILLGPQSAFAETLHEALASAYRTNPTLGAERARQRGTDEQVPQALVGWRPQISSSATAGHEWTRSQTTTGFGSNGPIRKYRTSEASPAALSIQLTQPIFDGFRTVAQTKAAEANVRAGRQQLLSTEQDVLFRTVQAYMNVIRDRRILELRRQNVTVLREQLRATKLRFDVGEVTKTDVSQSQARLSQALSAESSAKAQLEASAASYLTLTGRKPGKLTMPRSPRLPRSLDQALRHAQETNPNILAAAQVQDSASHQIDVARSGLLPSLSVRATASISEDWEVKAGNRQFESVEGILNVPIYDGGRTYSLLREAKQVESQRRIEIVESTRQVRESVISSWNFQASALDNISAAKSQVSAQQQALNGVREEYLVGSRSTLDVLNAQQELLNARISLVTAERDYVVATYQVLGNVGKLTARNLALRVPIYDPKVNYNKVRNKLFGADIGPSK